MQISIKTICGWPIYLTSYSICRWKLEKTGLHYADFPSLHYIVYESISCNHDTKLNYCQLPSYIHHRATYLSLPPYLSYYNWTLPSFFLYSSSNILLPTLICILLSYHVDFTHSLPSRSSHLHTVIPEASVLVALWTSFPLLLQTIVDSTQILDVILLSINVEKFMMKNGMAE